MIWLPLLDSQQHVIRLDAEEPRQEGLLVVGDGCVLLLLPGPVTLAAMEGL
jgi:hypothetical protein